MKIIFQKPEDASISSQFIEILKIYGFDGISCFQNEYTGQILVIECKKVPKDSDVFSCFEILQTEYKNVDFFVRR